MTGTAQERLNNQLAQTARTTADEIVQLEQANLTFLREIAFAGPNTQTGAPAVTDALAENNTTGLAQALDPYFLVSLQRQGVRADRLIAFNSQGQSVVDWERFHDEMGDSQRTNHESRDISVLWFVPLILTEQNDETGDKFAGLLDLGDDRTRYIFTVAPVVKEEKVVGGLIVATRLNTLLQDLRDNSSSAIVTLYQADNGQSFASTQIPNVGLDALNIQPELVTSIRNLEQSNEQGIYDTVAVNERDYQFAYAPLRIRRSTVGIISVALASDYVTGPWADSRPPLIILTVFLSITIIGLGIFIARQITRPLQELVNTAQAVSGGNLTERSNIHSQDEVGVLSSAFNNMTDHLLSLYSTVRAEAGQRAAIVESIADGVIVCESSGHILLINKTMRDFLQLSNDQTKPNQLKDIPIQPLSDTVLAFGEARTSDLFQLYDRVVRMVVTPVKLDDDTRLGDVYVFQDLTSEVTIDRAKTNFIATISHELRTPLTVLGGSSELLLRGVVGNISDDQRTLLETMRRHTLSMTNILNNVITIAHLEAGTITFDIEPIHIYDVLDELLWSVEPAIAAKGLTLEIDIPDNLPKVLADAFQLQNVFHQLLDNARRYTDNGTITITATLQDGNIRVDIIDTGCGIEANLSDQLFTRFARGTQGINSPERGIGLGLVIAKRLLELQGGRLWLEHTSEHGSTFSFLLMCNNADPDYQDRETTIATAA
ncbi:MAG: ATP-binding protein [Chloroflexota bacterium]